MSCVVNVAKGIDYAGHSFKIDPKMATNYIGQPTNRVDGIAKVTGQAKYAAEFRGDGLAYGVVVSSPVAKGTISRIDSSQAMALPGVLQVFTHENISRLAWLDLSYKDLDSPPGSPFRPLHSKAIQFSQQPIALVVAETFELARYAATLVQIDYTLETPETDLQANLDKAFKPKRSKIGYQKPKSRGDFNKAFDQSATKVEAQYFHSAEHHNPMEMHASTVLYAKDDHLTVYDKTQGVLNSQHYISMIFGLPKKKVRVLSPFVGGAFGSGLRPQYQLFLAVLAALQLKRSVRVVLTRQQMFSFGHRPAAVQQLALGAAPDGTLEAVHHAAFSQTSQFEDYTETIVNWSGTLYHCANVELIHKLVSLDIYTPLDMRAPGAATGVHALECAMDELAHELGMDPLALRLKNYTEEDPLKGKPYSSKELRACYQQGAEKFGWANRNPEPRSMRDGSQLVGWGVATGIWDAMTVPSRAKAVLSSDGRLTVSSATADIGTGTYTIMTQIAAETLGLPLEDVTFKLGDTSLPFAIFEGGSATAGSVGMAVKRVCEAIRKQVYKLAQKMPDSPFAKVDYANVLFVDGKIQLAHYPTIQVPIAEVVPLIGGKPLEETTTSLPNMLKQSRYALNTHSAVFVEVKVDEDLGTVKVTRVVSAIAGGRILNPKTARSQIMGAVVWGISMALEEDSVMDTNLGRFMNHNLAEYHVPVSADIHDIEVLFVEEKDTVVNPMGVKGLGEIGIIGVAAAVANAVFHATGKRVRDLPITLDKLL